MGAGHSLTALISGLRDAHRDPDEIDERFKELGIAVLVPVDDEREIPETSVADLFFPDAGGSLLVPGSEVKLCVPPRAVPQGKVYAIQGEYRKTPPLRRPRL